MSQDTEILPSIMDDAEMHQEAPIGEVVKTRLPVSDIIDAELPSEDEQLKYTHHYRKLIVKELTKGGIPEDAVDRRDLMNTLDSMDRQAFTRKRIAADKEIAQGTTSANAYVLAELIKSISPKQPEVDHTASIPQLPASIARPTTVDGEMAKSAPQDTYTTFMARHAKGDDEAA